MAIWDYLTVLRQSLKEQKFNSPLPDDKTNVFETVNRLAINSNICLQTNSTNEANTDDESFRNVSKVRFIVSDNVFLFCNCLNIDYIFS